jgi:hypothetical protein
VVCAVLSFAARCRLSCSAAFASSQVLGVQEDVQLREQDFGNFQGEGSIVICVRGFGGGAGKRLLAQGCSW